MFQSDGNHFSTVDRDEEMVVECFQIVHRESQTVAEYFSTSYRDRESVVECCMMQITCFLLCMYVC